jgi:hypothetical protein
MKLGTPNNWLRLEIQDQSNPYSSWTAHGVSIGAEFSLELRHDAIVFDTSDSKLRELAEFSDSAAASIRIPASEDGWIELRRDSRGGLAVGVRFCKQLSGSAYEAQFEVPGEFTRTFCRDLHCLLSRAEA